MPVPTFPSASEAKREEGFLESWDRLRLYYQRYTPPSPRAAVAVLHGGGDHSGRYAGLTAALVRAGFQVALVDFRGHGQSDGRRWYVDTFADYLRDVDAFVARVRAGAPSLPLLVVGHSQGAHIAALWGLSSGREVAGFVLSSPYLRLAMKPPPLKILGARIAGKIVPWLSVPTGIDYADLTSDPEMQAWTARDPLYGKATTPRWFEESARAQEEAIRGAAEFRYPLLVLLGDADRIADPAAGRAFFEAAGSRDKELKVYPAFRHELFNEVGREQAYADTVAWLATRAPGGGDTR